MSDQEETPKPPDDAPPRPRIAGARLVVQVAVIAVWIAMTVFLIFFAQGRSVYIRWVWILTLTMAVFRTLQLLSALGLLRRRRG